MSINTPQPSRVDIKRIISQLEVKLLLPTAKAIVDILEMTKNNPTALFTMASMLVLEWWFVALVGLAILKSFSTN